MNQNRFCSISSYLLLTALFLGSSSNASASTLPNSSPLVVQDRNTGKVTFIGSNSPNGIKAPGGRQSLINSSQGSARVFLRVYGNAFGINNPERDLIENKSFKIDGLPTVKYQQSYNNIPIFGAEVNVNLDKAGNLLSMGGKTTAIYRLNTTPRVSSSNAITTALRLVAKHYKLKFSDLKASKPQLKIYQPGIIDPGTGKAKLVWFVKVKPKKVKPIQQIVLVDARSPGQIVLTWNNNPHARNRQTYTAKETTTLPGTLVCSEATTGSNCVAPPGTNDSSKAHTFAADTYNFYLTNHGRDSIDGYGLPIISTVNYFDFGTCPNAFWDGNQMVYCDGLSQADDVVGHELTHGVTQYTSELLYYYQSGAINESLSDVWGEFIDLTNKKGNDTAAVRWKLGEDVPVELFGGPIRDMKNPTLFGHPDKMTSPNYYKGSEDAGGVHTNSGINNKAAYLMTDGGTFNGKTITGIGIPKVAKIYYRAQTTLLTSGTGYNDLYNYLNQSCSSLIGTSGITATDCTQVNNALLAVEMNKQPVPGFQPQALVCPVGKNPVNTFFDNVEGGKKWNFLTLKGNNPWQIDTTYATSGTNALYVADVDTATDSAAVMKTWVAIPAGAFLHFKHAFDFEYDSTKNYDGAVLEYSIAGSGVWQDVKPLFAQGQNYNGVIAGGGNNNLQGRNAFTKVSHGFVSTKYNLASLAGKTVRFRLRQANDTAVGAQGWQQDDFRIYTCQ
jgi:bacillolysin